MRVNHVVRSLPAQTRCGRFIRLAAGCVWILAAGARFAYGQNALLCTPTASPTQVLAEGIAERVGDIVLSCSGGTPATVVTGNLTFFLNVNVTNKLASGILTDVLL